MDGMNDFNNSTTGNTGSVPPEPAYTGQQPPQDAYGTPYAGAGYPPPPYGAVPPPVPGAPNPGLAIVLGFIPGVGAMYNGQFAKGLAHIVIFAVLTSLAKHNDFFGLFVAGWVFYMVFDSYQTARARRDGLQPPDPFGLNNIGERLGIVHGPNWNDFVARPAAGATTANTPPVPPYGPAAAQSAYQTPDFRYSTGPANTDYQDPSMRYTAGPGGTTDQGATADYASSTPYGVPPPPPGVPPYGTAYAGVPYAAPVPAFDPSASRSGLPSGAVWLIGLGVLALLSSLGHAYYFRGRFFVGSLLIVLGAGVIFQRLRRARGAYPEHSAAASWYAVNSSRGGVFLIAIGIFMLLDAAGVAGWHYTWPYLLILLGLYQIATRTTYNRMMASMPPAPYGAPGFDASSPYAAPQTAQTSSTAASTSIVPTRDEEGR